MMMYTSCIPTLVPRSVPDITPRQLGAPVGNMASMGPPQRKPFARPAGTGNTAGRPRSASPRGPRGVAGSSDAPKARKPPRSTNASPAAKGRPLGTSQTPVRPTSAGAPVRTHHRRTLSAPVVGAARPATRACASSTSRGTGADTDAAGLPPGRPPSGVGSRGGARKAAVRQ